MAKAKTSVKELISDLSLAIAALQKAELLFKLIEAAAGESADINRAFLLAQIGAEAAAYASDIADTALNNFSEVTA
jgi:hypothetical protein